MGRGKGKLVYRVGINDADYVVLKNTEIGGKRKRLWVCPYYAKWVEMLKRCYSKRYTTMNQSYKNCSVCKEWLIFSGFKTWMEKQDWVNKDLDKDLLVAGNKEYSPETCIFLHKSVNLFLTTKKKVNTGSSWNKRLKKYQSRCRNIFVNVEEHLGYYGTELEAHLAWKARKHELACQLADSEYVTDDRVREALRNRYKPLDNPS